MKPEQAAAAQLRERGISPSAVKVVLMISTSTTPARSPSSPTRPSWSARRSGRPRRARPVPRLRQAPVRPRLRLPAARLRRSRRGVVPGFARSFDVFGDGSVRVVYTRASLGHMSVVLRTARGEVLVAGDAIYLRRTLDDMHLPYRIEDEHLFRRSLREIRQYATETPEATIVPGHDWGLAARLGLLKHVLARRRDVDRARLAYPGDQVERLEAVEHVLERHGLGPARVVAAHVEGEPGGVQRVLARGEPGCRAPAGAGTPGRARCSSRPATPACPTRCAPPRRGSWRARTPRGAARGRVRSASRRAASSPSWRSSHPGCPRTAAARPSGRRPRVAGRLVDLVSAGGCRTSSADALRSAASRGGAARRGRCGRGA